MLLNNCLDCRPFGRFIAIRWIKNLYSVALHQTEVEQQAIDIYLSEQIDMIADQVTGADN